MKQINIFTLRSSLLTLMALPLGYTSMYAQDIEGSEGTAEEVTISRKAEKPAPVYEMQEVSGVVLDASTKSLNLR